MAKPQGEKGEYVLMDDSCVNTLCRNNDVFKSDGFT
jgi:hypothetical protein